MSTFKKLNNKKIFFVSTFLDRYIVLIYAPKKCSEALEIAPKKCSEALGVAPKKCSEVLEIAPKKCYNQNERKYFSFTVS